MPISMYTGMDRSIRQISKTVEGKFKISFGGDTFTMAPATSHDVATAPDDAVC